MLHLTTNTGPDLDTTSISEVAAAVHERLTAHADTMTVSWRVSIDGLP